MQKDLGNTISLTYLSVEKRREQDNRPYMFDASSAELMSESDSDAIDKVLQCSDEDYEAAEMIGGKLILHAAVAYKMIEGEKTELVPQIETNCQKQMLYERLGGEYNHKELLEEAKAQGVSIRTAERWNLSWIENGLAQKWSHGAYKKIG